MRDNISQIGGSTGGSGGSDEEPTEPEPDSAPPVDDIQQPAPAPPEPEPDPEPPGGGEDIQRDDPGPPAGGDTPTGSEPPAQRGSDDATGGGQTDTSGSNRGASGDIDFRFADQSDAIDADPQFRSDSRARGVAEELIRRGRQAGDTIGGGAADVIGADPAGRRVLQSFANAGTTIPGSVGVIGADAADAAGFITQPARDAVEPGARLGFGDVATIGAETATRTAEVGAAAGDAAIEGADRTFDINFDRRAAGEGAAISVTDDPQVRQQLAGSLAFGAASLGAAGPASSATRGAAGLASRGARSAADVGSSAASRAADVVDTSTTRRFVGDERAQLQIGDQRSRGDRDTGSTRIGADDIERRPSEPEQGPAAFPDPQGRFEGGAGFDRGSPDRGAVDGPADVDPSGSGDGFGYRSVETEVQTAQQPPRVDSPSDDLRDVVDVEQRLAGGGGASSRFSATGAGAAGVGALSQTADPTGIAPDPTVTGGPRVDPVNDPTSVALTTAVTGTQQVDPASDPTGISPGVEDQLGGGRLGGGTLSGDATGGGTNTGTLDETNDPTQIAPPASESDSETDTVAPTDTGSGTDQPPASDTDQPPVTDTPVPPVTGTPPVTDTPVPQTPRPPTRTPVVPAVRPPVRRRPRRPPEREAAEPDPLILGDDDDDDEPAPRPAAEAPLLPGFGAETFTAFATGAFGARELASGADEPSLVGELPTQTLADPSDDEAGALAAVSEQFFGEFGGGE